jgi:hypothetical protein
MTVVRALVVLALALLVSPLAISQATITTGFDSPTYVLGDVVGQNGWGATVNSPTKGIVEPAPPGGFGDQSLAIRLRSVGNLGVANHLYSPTIDPPAGETGSTTGGVVVADPRSTFVASLWYRAPSTPVISTRPDFRIAELNPSSKGAAPGDLANRYAQVRLFNTTNDASGQVRVEIGWYGNGGVFTVATVAHLDWGEWYRFDYLIELIDGTDGPNPNDRFTLTIFDALGNQLGTACGSTWELGWKSGTFGGGATARAVNGFDFWAVTGPDDVLVGHIDELTMTAVDTPERQVTIAGSTSACSGGTTTLTANAGGGTGTFTSYVWRDESNATVGNDVTFAAGPGTYTVTVTDTLCATATSNPFTVTALTPLTATISGAHEVGFGGTTTLTANATGGSGTIAGYIWRDAANNVVGTGATLAAGAGIYTVTITDTCGSDASLPHEVIEVGATATLDGYATVCSGESAKLLVSLTGSGPWTLTWSDGLVQTTDVPQFSRTVAPSQTTTYSIVAVSDQNGSGTTSGTATVNVVVVPAPVVTGTPAVTLGQPVTLRATAGYASYQWFRNGQPIAGATSGTLTIAAVSQSDLASYTVRGTRDGCTSAASAPFQLVLLGLPVNDDAIIPIVGTARGAEGSFFRTTVHLVNATDVLMEGEITFIDARIPRYPYRLEPNATLFIDDLLPATFSGLTSANIRRLRGPLPVVVAHVFNDAEEEGTSGLIERAVPLASALEAGDRAVLITPSDPVTTRFNVGLRSLAEGMTVRVERRNGEGLLVSTFLRMLPPSTLVQESATVLLGQAAGSSESLTFEVLAGGGVIYGAATDNGANDPNMQLATELAPLHSGRYVLPVAGAVQGQFDSRFATGLQLHNPTNLPLTATLTFHPAGRSASANDPQLFVAVAPHATKAFDDVVTAMGATGLGSLDMTVAASSAPVLLARIYSIADDGQTSMTTELVPEEEALTEGESGVIAAPHTPAESRFNIGIRTLAAGARITATVRNHEGDVLRVTPLTYAPSFFTQSSAETLLGIPFTGDESVVFTIEEGSATIYGVWTDNITQDPALQYAVRE